LWDYEKRRNGNEEMDYDNDNNDRNKIKTEFHRKKLEEENAF
jgi:hypothetical protein